MKAVAVITTKKFVAMAVQCGFLLSSFVGSINYCVSKANF
jgi:hypothetical protein